MKEALDILRSRPRAELLWASPRELLNIFQADEIGYHIITVTNDHLKKLSLIGKDLNEYSRDTVAMFYKAPRVLQSDGNLAQHLRGSDAVNDLTRRLGREARGETTTARGQNARDVGLQHQ